MCAREGGGFVPHRHWRRTFRYDHFTHDQVLRQLLPEHITVPSSFETVGHIAHLNLRDDTLPCVGLCWMLGRAPPGASLLPVWT